MKEMIVGTELLYRSNGHNYYKVYVDRGGRMVPGSCTLSSFTGRHLRQVIKDIEADIRNGYYTQARFNR